MLPIDEDLNIRPGADGLGLLFVLLNSDSVSYGSDYRYEMNE